MAGVSCSRVERLKTRIRLVGFGLLLLGGMFMPIGYGVSPKRDLSAFSNLADMGAFLKSGVVLMCAGVVVILAAVLLPGRFEE